MEVQLVGLTELQARIGAVPASVASRITDAMNGIVNVLADRMRSRMADLFRNPGIMQTSVATEVQSGDAAVVGTAGAYGLPYLAIQEFGGTTSPHDIFPVNAKALAFFMPGGFMPFRPGAATGDMVFTKVVHHPGSKIPERSYARSALAMERSNIVAMLQAAVNAGVAGD